jgi:hypothetical protein
MTVSSSVHGSQRAKYQSLRGATERAYATDIMGIVDFVIYEYTRIYLR